MFFGLMWWQWLISCVLIAILAALFDDLLIAPLLRRRARRSYRPRMTREPEPLLFTEKQEDEDKNAGA